MTGPLRKGVCLLCVAPTPKWRCAECDKMITSKRRHRYQTDPAYRAKQIARVKAYNHRKPKTNL